MKNPFTLSFNDSREKAEFKAACTAVDPTFPQSTVKVFYDVLAIPILIFCVLGVEITDIVQVCTDPLQCIPCAVKCQGGCAIYIIYTSASLDTGGVPKNSITR